MINSAVRVEQEDGEIRGRSVRICQRTPVHGSTTAAISSYPLKSLAAFDHFLAGAMGDIPGFVDDLIRCFLGRIGPFTDLLFDSVFQLAHGVRSFLRR